LVTVWSSVLGVERIGVHDNFFELGGHSLAALQILARLQSEFSNAISLQALFPLVTIAEQAAFIDGLSETDGSASLADLADLLDEVEAESLDTASSPDSSRRAH
ncbi:MAG: phosphopantetheine-binding protein, partial [Pseudomonadota bacterium]